MRQILIALLLLTACKETKDLKEKFPDASPAPDARLLPPDDTEPVLEAPVATPTPVPAVAPTPTPEPVVTPSPSPSPSPTPIAERCRDPEYPLIGSWQNVERPEDVYTFNDDCTFTHETCGLYAQPWAVWANMPQNNRGDLVMNPTGYNAAYNYCAQTGSGEPLKNFCGWDMVSENVILLNCHYFIGAQTYQRVSP